jgi:hypothetical protein
MIFNTPRGNLSAEKGSNDESPCISQEDLRQVQGHQPPWGGSCDLRERKAQAAPGLVESGIGGSFHDSGQPTADSE